MRKLLSTLILGTLVGCATPYQEKPSVPCTAWGGGCGGFETRELSPGLYEIHVVVENANRKRALEYFDRRRTELAQENGYQECKTLHVAAVDNPEVFFEGKRGAQADGRVECQ